MDPRVREEAYARCSIRNSTRNGLDTNRPAGRYYLPRN